MAEKPAFYNNWKGGSVPTGSTMSGATPNPYGGFQSQQNTNVVRASDPAAVLYDMSIPDRKEIAQLLKKAGYRVPTTGKYSESLVNAYAEALQGAVTQSTRLDRDFTLREYLTQEELPTEGEAKQPSIREDITIWDPTKIAGTVQDLSVKLLGREATPEEITYVANKLTAAQKKAAKRTQYVTKGGKVTATVSGGLDEEQFLVELFQKDKKFAPEIKAIQAKKATAEASEAETTRQDIMKTALANGVTLDPESITSFEQRLKAGEDINTIKNSIREIAALGMPENVKKLIASGTDLSAIYSPYKSILAQTLEINPNSITLDDPTLRMAIGPEKEMSLYEYQRSLRKDPRWQYTEQAREAVSDTASRILKNFGFQG